MSENLNVTPGTGATIRMVEKNSKKAQVIAIDMGGVGAENLLTDSMPITNPQLTIDSNFCGHIFVSSSSINVSGSTLNISNRNGFVFKPDPSNLGTVWFVYVGGYITGSLASGFPLSLGEAFLYSGSNLNMLDYGVTNASSGCVVWAKL